jgi:hypothetical protein
LQNQRGGDLVYNTAVLLASVAGFVEYLVCFAGGETLIAKMDRQTAQLPQSCGKGLRLCRLQAYVAGQMYWVANYDADHVKSPRQPYEGTQVFTLAPSALECQYRLSGQPQPVRHSDPDTAIADIQSEVARWGGRLQLFSS